MSWTRGAAMYEATVAHTRLRPTVYRLRHRTCYWLVDVDDPPRPPAWLRPLAGFRDMTGLRASVARFTREHGVDIDGCRVTMLAHARVLGYAFNPLTVYWCRAGDRLRCIVAEVRNTYGGSHRYLLEPDARGADRVGKEFYVSPFMPVAGEYRMRLPEPDDRLSLTVRLDVDGEAMLVATVEGRRREAGTAAVLAAAIRYPLSTLAVSAAIRFHGIRLWLRGLPITPRDRTNRKGHRDRTG
ncbi:DUF1365 domain-containing protein [Glycomyces salinus]|uniref:DUF1365 domain-containing protein n=1 Tax=Glycomyces salinus TaxID=980294 RepID=UPI001E43F961|nr:DUF1365 domain-containing protein [Glycomyces salinus]